MADIREFEGIQNFAEAVKQAYTADLSVLRGGLGPQQLERIGTPFSQFTRDTQLLLPLERRLYTRHIKHLREARESAKDWHKTHYPMRFPLHYLGAEAILSGGVEPHIDLPSIKSAASVNLHNGARPTTFYARRIADARAPYREIEQASNGPEYPLSSEFGVRLEPGDFAIFSRGVRHAVSASPDRKTLMLITRGFF